MTDPILTVLTPATTRDLTTLERAKTELGITNSDSDAKLRDWIHDASDLIARHLRRTLARETVQETFRGCWRAGEIQLARWPVVSITSIAVDGVALDDDQWELDYDAGLLYRLWNGFRQNFDGDVVIVIYTAGYDLIGDLPRNIERAALVLLQHWTASAGRDPMLRSESVENVVSRQYWVGGQGQNNALPPTVLDLLDEKEPLV